MRSPSYYTSVAGIHINRTRVLKERTLVFGIRELICSIGNLARSLLVYISKNRFKYAYDNVEELNMINLFVRSANNRAR